MPTIRILVADDHKLVREGIVAMLSLRKDFEVVGQAQNGEEAVSMVKKLNPDVVLMDIRMPGTNGITAARRIKSKNPNVKIIMLTMLDQEGYVYEAVKAGATGYLLKNISLDDLSKAIIEIYDGGATLHPKAQAQLLKEFINIARRDTDNCGLTPRELEILQLLSEGCSNKAVSERLFVSLQTVKTHVAHIFEKLEAKDRTEAVATAMRRGLVT